MPATTSFRPVLHSVSYSGAWPGHSLLTVEEFLDKAVELGYSSIALVAKRPHLSPLDYPPAARLALRRRIESLQLELAALMGYTDFTGSVDRPGIPCAEMNAAYVGVLCQLAADLGAPRIRIFTGYERPGIPYDQQYGELVRGLLLAAEAAARHGVTLLLQNHHDLAVHHEQFLWLLEEVNHPHLRAGFDAWAPFLQGLSGTALREAARRVGKWVAWTTVADYQIQPRYQYHPHLVNYTAESPALVRAVPPGDGQVDYASFFAGLRDAGFAGHAAYEMCAPLRGGGSIANLDATARAFRAFLAKF